MYMPVTALGKSRTIAFTEAWILCVVDNRFQGNSLRQRCDQGVHQGKLSLMMNDDMTVLWDYLHVFGYTVCFI